MGTAASGRRPEQFFELHPRQVEDLLGFISLEDQRQPGENDEAASAGAD